MKHLLTKRLATVVNLEQIFSKRSQERYRGTLLLALTIGTGAITVDTYFYDFLEPLPLLGGLAILAGLYSEAVLLRLYSNSAYYSGLASRTGQGNYQHTGITYDVAKVIYGLDHDLTAAFLTSTFGTHIYVRCGLTETAVSTWLTSNRQSLPASTLTTADNRATTLIEVVRCLLTHDIGFVEFLTQHGVTADTFRAVSDMVFAHYYEQKRQERWWSRDVLGRRGSLGRTLTLGAWREYVPFTEALRGNPETVTEEEQHYLNHFAEVLQARRDSNLIVVVPDVSTGAGLLGKLQYLFDTGTALGSVNSMSLITINHSALLQNYHDTISVESALRHILTAATKAGNMTIVIENITTIASDYLARGVLFTHILDEFLTADRLHVILTTTPNQYANLRKEALALVKRCHETIIEPLSTERMMALLSQIVFPIETRYNTILSYAALRAITETAVSYDAPTTETAKRLLVTIGETFQGTPIVTGEMALSCLGAVLHLPIGETSAEERDTLLSLETTMAQTIVGQERAVKAIAIALRRMRANLHDTDRPFASFLFLGPSGVGKTETAKTVAAVYFGDESRMMRLDMSEYAGGDSLHRLIGNGSEPSVLERYLATHPRGLILLDEFEKAHPQITKLFLQILDEGSCTTYDGTTLNFTNHLIIATSNAGSDLIARTSDKRALAPVLDSDIIAHIIQTGALPAELIGRFGDVILFDSLTYEDKLTIATHIINQLKKKIADRGFSLEVAPGVVETIINQTETNTFGARPIRHLIEHSIEDIIATHIIRGDVKPGDTITIKKTDIKN